MLEKIFEIPVTNLQDTEKEIKIIYKLPRIDKKEIQLNLFQAYLELMVKGKNNENFCKFYKAITLPSEIIRNKIKASYDGKILEVIIPKSDAGDGGANIKID